MKKYINIYTTIALFTAVLMVAVPSFQASSEIRDDSLPYPAELYAMCFDGIDNDGDGFIDANDPECPRCYDHVDNDGDTFVDKADPDCPAMQEVKDNLASVSQAVETKTKEVQKRNIVDTYKISVRNSVDTFSIGTSDQAVSRKNTRTISSRIRSGTNSYTGAEAGDNLTSTISAEISNLANINSSGTRNGTDIYEGSRIKEGADTYRGGRADERASARNRTRTTSSGTYEGAGTYEAVR